MAGAAGRNLGKTEFLCRAIRKRSESIPVIGIKITTIDDALADYRNIDGDYVISKEEPADDNKDTHRMFRSGASKVFWLRVKRPALQQGLDTLFQTLEVDGIDLSSACLVMESGGARKFVEPGLFFIIREHNDEMKPAVLDVAHYADSLNNVTGSGWDVLPEDLSFENDRWGMKEKAGAIILSGGASSRMGKDKSLLELGEKPMIASIHEQLHPNFGRVVISGQREKYAFVGCPVIEDIEPGQGALMGLYSSLKRSEYDLNFVTTCDVPDINLPLVRRMLKQAASKDAVILVDADKRKQPLFAIYNKSVVPIIEKLVGEGKQAVFALLDVIDVGYVQNDGDWYHNLNTHDDLERYREARK